MRRLCLLLAFFSWGCSPPGGDSVSLFGSEVGLDNRLLRDQVEAYSKTLPADRQHVLLTVSVTTWEDAPAFAISNTINYPRHSSAKCLAYDVINGYLVVFYDYTRDTADTHPTKTELQGKIQEMGIKLSDKFMLYEARMCLIRMDHLNGKILRKECN